MMSIRRSVAILLILGAVFIAPGLCAYVFFQHPDWLGAATNRGLLLTPPKRLQHLDPSGHHQKWRLILWSPEACDNNCMEAMDRLARIRLALGRKLYNMNVCLLLGSSRAQFSAADVKILHEKDSHVLTLPAYDHADHAILGSKPAIYIVNPANYVILKFKIGSESDDIFHDIKQLVQDK